MVDFVFLNKLFPSDLGKAHQKFTEWSNSELTCGGYPRKNLKQGIVVFSLLGM